MSRPQIVLAVLGGCGLSLLVGVVFVRLMLDWSDSLGYQGPTTERRYAVIAVIAMCIWWGGSGLSIMFGRRAWRRAERAALDQSGSAP